MSISLLRRLLMKEAVKDTASSSGIMSINKNITEKVEKQEAETEVKASLIPDGLANMLAKRKI